MSGQVYWSRVLEMRMRSFYGDDSPSYKPGQFRRELNALDDHLVKVKLTQAQNLPFPEPKKLSHGVGV